MTVILAFLVALIAFAGWWLVRQGVMSKPWLETGPAPASAPAEERRAGRLGLVVLLAVVGCLFALFGSAFVMRMDIAEPQAWALPPAVWSNTLLLVLASVFLHFASGAARRQEEAPARLNLALAALATAGFLAGQLMAWGELAGSGHGLATGPAASFFYLLSGLHGLHILGGLLALAAVARRPFSAEGLGLCAVYWHFLLLVWLGLLALFLGWANELIDLCRGILT